MKMRTLVAGAVLLAGVHAPGFARAGNFALVNGTDQAMSSVSIRRFGTESWEPLPIAPSPGARGSVPFKNDDCAFDIQATLDGGGSAVWSGVNLCEAKAVTLHRDGSGAAWVEYE